jgi:DNA-binding transcriptional ArsR family regulator
MFTEEATGPRTKRVTATASLVTDLSWLLHVAAGPSMRAKYPRLAEMFEGREDLADRVCNFWSDSSPHNDSSPHEDCFTEMQVLAQHADAVGVTDPDVLWSALEEAVATVPLDLEMPSESPEDRETYLDRLRQLRESPALLRSYLELLEEVWAPVDAMWQQALPVIEETGRQVLAQYERGRSLELLIPQGCDILRVRLPDILARVEAGEQPILFVPCLFFGSSMYLEVSGLVTIGTGVGQGDAVAREQTESVARRLKAVADPTRLAILHSLATASSTVGELAVLFRLAQPTVSMHVKVLRENGLVRSQREGGRLRLTADAGAVELLLDELRQAVLQGADGPQPAGASTTGRDRMPATVVDRTLSADPVTA